MSELRLAVYVSRPVVRLVSTFDGFRTVKISPDRCFEQTRKLNLNVSCIITEKESLRVQFILIVWK